MVGIAPLEFVSWLCWESEDMEKLFLSDESGDPTSILR